MKLSTLLTVGLDAYKARLTADGYTGETYKEQLRKFFESYAYVWRVQYSDTKLAQFPEKDVHSHARLRVNGVVIPGKKGLYLVTVGAFHHYRE